MWEYAQHTSQLRTWLEQQLIDLGNVHVNGNIRNRLPNTTNICFAGVKADSLIAKVPDIALSTGSACSSAIAEPSHVLKAMGIPDERAYSSIRFSLGKYTTKEEIDSVLEKIKKRVKEERG
jgi:cysteine desulfurase